MRSREYCKCKSRCLEAGDVQWVSKKFCRSCGSEVMYEEVDFMSYLREKVLGFDGKPRVLLLSGELYRELLIKSIPPVPCEIDFSPPAKIHGVPVYHCLGVSEALVL